MISPISHRLFLKNKAGYLYCSMFYFKGVRLPKITGITLWPIVLLKPKFPSVTLINHERIHLRQQIEMLILPFYIWYLFEWLIRFIKSRNFEYAYRNICFEREAYTNDTNLEYLKQRSLWSFLKYL